jgi:multidrug resistance efflux pump
MIAGGKATCFFCVVVRQLPGDHTSCVIAFSSAAAAVVNAALEAELSALQEQLSKLSAAAEVEAKESERTQRLQDDLDRLDAGEGEHSIHERTHTFCQVVTCTCVVGG